MSETLGILVIVKALGILCVAFIYLSCTKMSTKYLKWKEDKRAQVENKGIDHKSEN